MKNNADYRGLNASGEWEYGGINNKRNMIVKGFIHLSVDPITVGENTYCLDSKGNSTWEDDIVVPLDTDIPELPMVVTYVSSQGQWVMEYTDPFGQIAHYPLRQGKFTICGNIHQHSELLHTAVHGD